MGRSTRSIAKVAVLASLVALVGTSTGASGLVPSAPPFSPPEVGVLRLHLGATDYFRFDPVVGSAVTQSIAVPSGCAVTPDTTLVNLTPQPAPSQGTVGLFDNGLGVRVKGEGTGTPCGRINGTSQALVLALTGPTVGNYEIDYAELDIEAKGGATAKAVMYLDGVVMGTDLLTTGANSDSGPDSTDGDNFRWLVAPDSGVPFDKLVLTVDASTPDGAISLEGGADGTLPQPGGLGATLQTTDSLFHLVDIDGVLNCGDTVIEGNPSNPLATPNADASLDRDQNISGTCVPIPYLLRSGNDNVELLKDLGGQTAAQFSITITWQPEPAVNPLPASTTIDYDGAGTASTAHNVLWCEGSAAAPTLPGIEELWCLTNQSATLVGGGNVQVTETYYGAGDPVWLR